MVGRLIAPIFMRLLQFFSKVVTGSVTTMNFLSLIPVGVQWWTGEIDTTDVESQEFSGWYC